MIESDLRSTDAALIFYDEGFKTSAYCQQEIGWLLVRGAPVIGLKHRGVDPMDFASKHQRYSWNCTRIPAL